MSNSSCFTLSSRLSPALRENFSRLLAPRHIAFMGGAYAESPLRNIRRHGFAGEVYVVNARRDEIGGYRCYRSLSDLPVSPDATYLGVNADVTIGALEELNRLKAGGVVCYASGV